MSKDAAEWRVKEWLEESVRPQDSVSVREEPIESMVQANHGALDHPTCDRMWRHAQRQTNRDGRPRIPLQPNISEALDAESQAAMWRGVAAKQQRQSREKLHHQEWEKNRSGKSLQHQELAHVWT